MRTNKTLNKKDIIIILLYISIIHNNISIIPMLLLTIFCLYGIGLEK